MKNIYPHQFYSFSLHAELNYDQVPEAQQIILYTPFYQKYLECDPPREKIIRVFILKYLYL